MYRLKELDIRIPAGCHVIKASQADVLTEASGILAEAEHKAEEIVAAARERYEEERKRGYEDGLAEARREAVARLLQEQATLDSCLASLGEALADVVGACVRKVIGSIGDQELARAFISNAIRQMRRQKRIRLGVSPAHYPSICGQIESIRLRFPEIELIDVSENHEIDDLSFVLESEIGRIEGSIEKSLQGIEDQLHAAIRQHVSEQRPQRIAPAATLAIVEPAE